MSFFSVRDASSFFFRSCKFSRLYHREAPSKSSQGFTLCFQLSFRFIILLLPEFSMEALHGGSSRILFILQLFFKIPLSKLWPAKLYSKLNMVLNTCFVLRRSSILRLAFQSAILLPYLLRWCYIILDNFHSCFTIHMLSRMRYFKSINLFVGVILCHISPKAFPEDCCYHGGYNWPKFFFILPVK